MDTAGERLREYGKKTYGTLRKFAEVLDMKEQTLNQYLSGKSLPGNKLQQKLRDLGADVEYIMTGQHSIASSLEKNFIRTKIKFYRVIKSVNAGDPVFIYSEVNDTGEVAGFEYEKTERCFALKVQGDSMFSPTGKSLQEGDKVLVDMDAEILSGDVVVLSLRNGRELIKQYQMTNDDKDVRLHSFNPQYPDIIVKKSEVNVMYRVVGKSSVEVW